MINIFVACSLVIQNGGVGGNPQDHAPDSDPSNEPISDGSDQGHFGHFMRKQVSVTRGARNSAKVTGLFNGSISSTVWRVWKETDESRKSRV